MHTFRLVHEYPEIKVHRFVGHQCCITRFSVFECCKKKKIPCKSLDDFVLL